MTCGGFGSRQSTGGETCLDRDGGQNGKYSRYRLATSATGAHSNSREPSASSSSNTLRDNVAFVRQQKEQRRHVGRCQQVSSVPRLVLRPEPLACNQTSVAATKLAANHSIAKPTFGKMAGNGAPKNRPGAAAPGTHQQLRYGGPAASCHLQLLIRLSVM